MGKCDMPIHATGAEWCCSVQAKKNKQAHFQAAG